MTSSKHQKNKVGESGLPDDDDDDDDDDDGAFNSESIFGKPEKVTLLQSLHQIFGFMNIGFARKKWCQNRLGHQCFASVPKDSDTSQCISILLSGKYLINHKLFFLNRALTIKKKYDIHL